MRAIPVIFMPNSTFSLTVTAVDENGNVDIGHGVLPG